jgi:hypothetical protein
VGKRKSKEGPRCEYSRKTFSEDSTSTCECDTNTHGKERKIDCECERPISNTISAPPHIHMCSPFIRVLGTVGVGILPSPARLGYLPSTGTSRSMRGACP